MSIDQAIVLFFTLAGSISQKKSPIAGAGSPSRRDRPPVNSPIALFLTKMGDRARMSEWSKRRCVETRVRFTSQVADFQFAGLQFDFEWGQFATKDFDVARCRYAKPDGVAFDFQDFDFDLTIDHDGLIFLA
jgi:hypothetical protein